MEHRCASLLTQAPAERTKDKTTTERMKPDMEKIQVSSGVKRSEDCMGFPHGSVVKNPPAMQETQV